MKFRRYLAFEGIDGSGKDLQLKMLAEHFDKVGIPYIKVAEPSDNIIGRQLREFLKTGEYQSAHAALFFADRVVQLEEIIEPALDKGLFVLSSRSYLSTLAYQRDFWGDEWLTNLNSKLPEKPGHIFVFDVSPYEAMRRIANREVLECYETRKELKRVRANYLGLAAENPDHNIHVIDGAGTEQEVHQEVMQYIKQIPEVLR